MAKDATTATELKLEIDPVRATPDASSGEADLFPPVSLPSDTPLGFSPPPIPQIAKPQAAGSSLESSVEAADEKLGSQRRQARRRPAGPMRGQVAANDDAPSIGGLIYALDQKPSTAPLTYARIASTLWAILGIAFFWSMISGEIGQGATIAQIIAKPATFLMATAIIVPIAIIHFLAVLAWRAEELRMRSSTMTEVAVRLAEPDRMAEQSVASLGQAVRRQVSFMNDAVSRALGRAGELEALVHNEVSALERSYADNERKIRGLIAGLAGEREALVTTSDRVSGSLATLGTDIPELIEKLSNQQLKLAQIIQGAGDNLTALETAVGQSAVKLETTLGERTDHLQGVLETYTGAIGNAIGHRTDEIQGVLDTYTTALADALGSRSEQLQSAITEYMYTLDDNLAGRTENMQAIFNQYGSALDSTLAQRAQYLDAQLVERTRALDAAFNDRLRLFDESIMRSTIAIDTAVNEKSQTLTNALELHAKSFSETITQQTLELDESLVRGIGSVRRSSENITRQSLKAIEGLAGQSELLRSVSENLLGQINTVTNRFEHQGQSILKAANSLESANYKIDATLQNRHAELSQTLEMMSGKAEEFGRFVHGYSSSIEGTMTDVESRVRSTAEQVRLGTEATKRAAMAELDQLRSTTDAESQRALEDMRQRARTAAELAAEQGRLKDQFERMPMAARESTELMRGALQEQLKALDQLSSLTSRTVQQRDVAPPVTQTASLTSSYARAAATPALQPHAAPAQPLAPHPQAPRAPFAPPSAEPRDGWKLGDLLARASFDDNGENASNAPSAEYQLNIGVIARAIDPATTSAIWSRLRNGHRNVMVRSIYSADGRLAFDDVSRRYKTDPQLQQTVERYLADFEMIKADAERRDPSGRLAETHLISDSGRVYLFLAHASGRSV